MQIATGGHERMLKVALFHSLFSNFGDIEANVMNYMSVPVRKLFISSLSSHYGINTTTTSPEFELIYSTIASTFFFGVLFGGFVMGHLMDNMGRKGTAVHVRSVIGMLSPLLMIMAKYLNSIELFAMGQFLAGIVATFKFVLFIYIAECSPDETRGFTAMAVGTGGNLLLLLVTPFCLPQAFGTDRNWWLLPAFCLLLAAIHLFVAGLFPESPKHLYIIQRHCITARRAIRFYHGPDTNADLVIQEYEREKRLIHFQHVTFRELFFSRRLRWCLIIIMISGFIPATSLINLKSQYLQPMLMSFDMDQSKAMMSTMLMTALTSPLCLLAPFLVERFGRRPIFIIITVLATSELFFVSIAQSLVDLRGTSGGDALRWMTPIVGLLGFALGQASAMLGLLNMAPILIGEICPHAARAAMSKIMQIIPIGYILVLVITYPIVTAKYGVFFLLPLFFFSAVLCILMYKYLPETKGLPVDEIYRRLAEKSINSLSDGDDENPPYDPAKRTKSFNSYGSISGLDRL